MVDTGATFVSIGKKDIKKLGLDFDRDVDIITANGNTKRKLYDGSKIEMLGRVMSLSVMDNDDTTPPLIGHLLLEGLDFVVNLRTKKVEPNPKSPDGKWYVEMY